MPDRTPDAAGLPTTSSIKIMALRRPHQCACGCRLNAGDRAAWDRSTRTVRCLPCAAGMATAHSFNSLPASDDLGASLVENPGEAGPRWEPPDPGVAGGSAQAEFDRRHARRESTVRAAHPRLGGLILAPSDDSQSARAWQSGAVGERRLGEKLEGLGGSVVALHDRRVPRSRANIDHIVVGPAGVYVVDAKHYKGASLSIRRSGGFLSPVREQLIVAGRDRTKLATAMDWQVAAVRTALEASSDFAETPVVAVLCFVDAQFPLFGKLQINGVQIRGLGGTAKLVTTAGPLDEAARGRLARQLAEGLPPQG